MGLKLQLADAQTTIAELQAQAGQDAAVHTATKQKRDDLWQSQLLQQQGLIDKAAANEQLRQELLSRLAVQEQQQQEHAQLVMDLSSARQQSQQLTVQLQQCSEQHLQERRVMSGQLASTSQSLCEATQAAKHVQQQMQTMQLEHMQQQQLWQKEHDRLHQDLHQRTQQCQDLEQQLQDERQQCTDTSDHLEELKRNHDMMHAEHASTAHVVAELRVQLADVTARKSSAEATHKCLMSQSQKQAEQQQHHHQSTEKALQQEVHVLQTRLAVLEHRPLNLVAGTQTTVHSRSQACQTDDTQQPSDALSQVATLTEQTQILQVLQTFLLVLRHICLLLLCYAVPAAVCAVTQCLYWSSKLAAHCWSQGQCYTALLCCSALVSSLQNLLDAEHSNSFN